MQDSLDFPTVYLTTEQIQRLAGLSCDALAGIQFRTTDAMDTIAVYSFVDVDSPNTLKLGVIHPDGSYEDQT